MNDTKNKPVRTFGLVLYLIGAILGLALLALSVWGDIEGSTFGAAQSSDERLDTLKCPVFITEDEVATISAEFVNETDRDVEPLVRSSITLGYVTLVDEQSQRVEIPAGDSRQLTWEISEENAAYRRLVLARFYQLRHFGLPSREGSCGVVVLPITGLTGGQAYIAIFTASLVSVIVGLFLYTPKDVLRLDLQVTEHKRMRTMIRSFIVLAAYFLVASLLSLVADPLVSIALLFLAVISTVVVFSFALSGN